MTHPTPCISLPGVCRHGPRAVFLCQYEGYFWLRKAAETWLTNKQIVHLLEECPDGLGHTFGEMHGVEWEVSHFPFRCFGATLEGRCA